MNLSLPLDKSSYPELPHSHFIRSDQKGLFYGLEFVREEMEEFFHSLEFKLIPFFKDGDMIFKNQKLLQLYFKEPAPPEVLQKIEKILSYFSGLYTLSSLWVEDVNTKVMASPTPKFPYSDLEEKAILQSGAHLGKPSMNPCHTFLEAKELLKKEGEIYLLADNFSKKELEEILNEKKDSLINLQGHIQLEDVKDLEFDSLYPSLLQGHFPSLKMKIF